MLHIRSPDKIKGSHIPIYLLTPQSLLVGGYLRADICMIQQSSI